MFGKKDRAYNVTLNEIVNWCIYVISIITWNTAKQISCRHSNFYHMKKWQTIVYLSIKYPYARRKMTKEKFCSLNMRSPEFLHISIFGVFFSLAKTGKKCFSFDSFSSM